MEFHAQSRATVSAGKGVWQPRETGGFRMLSIKTNRVAQTASCHLLVNYKMMLVAMPTPPTGFCFYLLRRAVAAAA